MAIRNIETIVSSRDDNTATVVGSEGRALAQSGNKTVTRQGAAAAQADYDFNSYDLVANDGFETDDNADIGGTDIILFGIESDDNNPFTITVRFFDDDGNVVHSKSPPTMSNVTEVDRFIPVYGDIFDFKIVDKSGGQQNNITGSINAHGGSGFYNKEQVFENTQAAGSGSAASVTFGDVRKDFDFFYDVGSGGSLHVEVSNDGNNWRYMDSLSISSGGGKDIVQYNTTYAHARVYADGADFSDSDVNLLEVTTRGD